MGYIRHAAVAGMFYPGNARDLHNLILRLIAEAGTRSEPGPVPKAIIAPHAGFKYSGSVAASAYVRLKPGFDRIRRVVLVGPSHRVPVSGVGVSSARAFETPLGTVPVDEEGVAQLSALPHIEISDEAHAEEHSVEVQLPFLQCLLDEFSILPLVCNNAAADTVADVLHRVWGGAETLIVISSDLSHYLSYTEAVRLDGLTCRAIEVLDHGMLKHEQACGHAAVGGLLAVAKRRRMRVATLDLRNSGDTAGDKRRVVGYGSWMFLDRPSRTQEADTGHGGD